MYLKIGDQFLDTELSLLSELLALLDQKIIETLTLIESSFDPESEGHLDRCEYFIGVGFSAIQQYLTDTLGLTKIPKKVAISLGPVYSENITYVSALNAAANFWKHSPEWWLDKENIRKDSQATLDTIRKITESDDYQLSNVLAELVGSSDLTLSALLPNLIAWRSAVDTSRKGIPRRYD
jgi:hypothetical protein